MGAPVDHTPPDAPAAGAGLIIAIPVFNDWESLGLLVRELDRVLLAHRIDADILMLDDGSITPPPPGLAPPGAAGRRIDILHLRRNLGHQRAIAVGLAFVHDTRACEAVLVMDGDGEDRPADVPVLLERFRAEGGRKIIFAARTKRSESIVFRTLYFAFRMLHRVLTGVSVRVGNFSVIPFRSLRMLVVVSEMWNHYAAAVVKARIPYDMVPTTRGRRLAGTPTMNFVALVVHGLSALSIFADVIGVRLLVAAVALLVAGTATIVPVVTRYGIGSVGAPGWALPAGAIFLLLLSQIAGVSLLLIFLILSARSTVTFIPLRDYAYFVDSVTRVSPE